jgi:hypothetical protein
MSKCHFCGTKHTGGYDACPGPAYPSLPGVAKHRKIANPTAAERAAHGDAVHAAVQALQKRELQAGRRAVPDCGPYKYVWKANSARLFKPMPVDTRYVDAEAEPIRLAA